MREWFWKRFDIVAPTTAANRKLMYVRALERLLLTSTAGAFFFAFARNIPVHFNERSCDPNWTYTIDLFLRYGYLLWLLAYFLVSSASNDLLDENRDCRSIFFDGAQAILALTAAYFLGFILQDPPYGLFALAIANGVVLIICVLSLVFFRKRSTRGLNKLRVWGIVISGISIVVALVNAWGAPILIALLPLHLLLWLLWWVFLRIRLADPATIFEAQ
jgi:hypothetical protein